MKKWLFPPLSAVLFASLVLLFFAIGVGRNGDGSRFFEALLSVLLVGICFVTLPPAIGFLYAKLFLRDEGRRIPYTLYQSLVISLPYPILCFDGKKTLLYALALLAWTEAWSLLGLVRFRLPTRRLK